MNSINVIIMSSMPTKGILFAYQRLKTENMSLLDKKQNVQLYRRSYDVFKL